MLSIYIYHNQVKVNFSDMEELFRKQPPVKPTNTASNGNATNGGSKETSQVDGISSGKKKDAVSVVFKL